MPARHSASSSPSTSSSRVANAPVIRVQDRDLDSLADADRRTVRTLQRAYVELWVDLLARLDPSAATAQLRARAHAGFGLMNSTPHTGPRRDARDPGADGPRRPPG